MKGFILLVCSLCIAFDGYSKKAGSFDYQTGDLLFQDLDCGALCDAIEKVTPGLGEKHFSHVGMVFIKGNAVFVIEAIGAGVHATPIKKFLSRQLDDKGHPKVVVGRLKSKYRKLNAPAVAFALKQKGVPYDDVFGYDNGKYYCSELIYDAFRNANQNNPLFDLPPMSFKDPATGTTFPAWADYYDKLQQPVPEGAPGCNPGSIATSSKIDIVASFY